MYLEFCVSLCCGLILSLLLVGVPARSLNKVITYSSIYRNHRNSNLDLYSLHEIVRIPTFAGDNRVHWTCRCHSHCSRKYYHHLYRGHRFLLVRNLGYNISDRLRNLMPSTVRMRRLEATALYGERPYCTRSRCKGGTTRLWGVMGSYGRELWEQRNKQPVKIHGGVVGI